MLNKKILAAAVVGALFAGNAAAVQLVSQNASLTAPGAAATAPAVFAKEIVVPAAGKQLTTNLVAPISWQIGYSFSEGEVRYVRLEGPAGFKFGAGTPAVADGIVGAVNGVGTNVLYFSVTADVGGLPAANVITFAGDHTIANTSSNVSLTASLYDQPSQAQNGGDTGKIVNATATGGYLTFSKSYDLVSDTVYTSVADVEADTGAFTKFVGNNDWTELSELTYGLYDPAGPQAATYTPAGTLITLANLFDSADVLIEGDFSAASNVWWDSNADDLTAAAATFEVNTTPRSDVVELTVDTETAISAGSYTAKLVPVANISGEYTVSPITAVPAGTIIRNGTELQAPLVQIPGGWIARIVLTNTGALERPYTINVLTEEGKTFQIASSKLTGTVPATGTQVVELNSADLASGSGLRGTLVVNVAGPDAQIQGLYQIVNPTSGLVNNHVLVRPGTN